jgi:DUF2924 family protein
MPRDGDDRQTPGSEAARIERAARLVEEIAVADHDVLRLRWQSVFGHPPPRRSRAELLRHALAYEAQAEIFGGTDRIRRRLDRLARGEADPLARAALRLKQGTRLVREWQGEVHQVTVLEQGIDYRGTTYRSLSEVARLITGTRWSGPLFFGVKKAGVSR